MADDLPKNDGSEKPSEAERLTILAGKFTMDAARLGVFGSFISSIIVGIFLVHYGGCINQKDSSLQPGPVSIEKAEKKVQEDAPKIAEPVRTPTISPTPSETVKPNVTETPYKVPEKSWMDAFKSNSSKLYGFENLQKQRSILDGINKQPEESKTFYEHAKEDAYFISVGVYKFYRKLPGLFQFLIFCWIVGGIGRVVVGLIKGE